MKYITVDDNRIISGIFCGKKTEGNEIDVPANFNGLEGQSLDFFDSDFCIKPLQVLIDEGLISESIAVDTNIETLTPEQIKLEETQTILNRLAEIDLETIRPLRATLAGTQTEADTAKLLELEKEACELRSQVK